MKKHLNILVLCACALIVVSCKSKIETISGYFDYETECVSVNRSGLQTVKAWGIGMDEKEAILNARRRAIDDVLFKGLRGGNSSCNMRPIVSNPNAKINNEQYFNQFYAPKGDFEKYAGLPDENWLRRKLKVNKKSEGEHAFEIIIEIDMQGLKSHLRNDNIIQ